MLNRQANYDYSEVSASRILKENYIEAPPINVQTLAEDEGLNVVEAEFQDGGVAGFIDLEKKCIVVNAFDSPQRKRFTIAHELAHWVLHKDELEDNKDMVILYRKPLGRNEEDAYEQEANCFAANLLVPHELLKHYIELGFNNTQLASLFNVSQAVIGFRREAISSGKQ